VSLTQPKAFRFRVADRAQVPPSLALGVRPNAAFLPSNGSVRVVVGAGGKLAATAATATIHTSTPGLLQND
jgi:hypothetical protein